MKRKYIYPEELEYIIWKRSFIPRPVREGSKLVINRRYYVPSYKGIVKVIDSFTLYNNTYYIITYGGNMSGCVSHPLGNGSQIYELIRDNRNIKDTNIVNSGESYYGYEIKYWFIKNEINFHKVKYKDFQKYFYNKEYELYF